MDLNYRGLHAKRSAVAGRPRRAYIKQTVYFRTRDNCEVNAFQWSI